jgi:16S rRNA (cytidine1402-2'-O)-methyltransferase
MGTLYLIATPIGNLEDISARALRLLREVSLIAAEDTRQTRKLLAHFDIHTPLTSYFEHNKLEKLSQIVSALQQGDVALVSDAGTPGLNDPGYELVRAALESGYPVSPVPGACAPVAALVASGLPTDAFLYLGYLPRKAIDRRRFLGQVSKLPYTLIFLESPHRLMSALEDVQAVLGSRQIAVARELTKLHEEIYRGSLEEARQHFAGQEPRGEFTLVVSGYREEQPYWDDVQIRAALEDGLDRGLTASKLASELAARSGWPRRTIYQYLVEIQNQRKNT